MGGVTLSCHLITGLFHPIKMFCSHVSFMIDPPLVGAMMPPNLPNGFNDVKSIACS